MSVNLIYERGRGRVAKGGGWHIENQHLVSARVELPSGLCGISLGFRIVMRGQP